MCGIAGYLDYNCKTTSNELKQMTDVLFHRGPDCGNYWEYANQNFAIGFGHRRLSIIELSSAGNQPMHFNGISITYNGEVYNYKEIKKELENFGRVFKSNSDTEVILQAYDQWGINCISKFIGMFAFVLHDLDKQKLFFVRDRAGVKPLFIFEQDSLLLFASELKSFHQHSRFTKSINSDSVALFLNFGNVGGNNCIYKNAYKVRAGHYVEVDLLSRNKQSIQYWNVYDFYNKPFLDISFNEAKLKTEELLISSANYRMIADVDVGVFLSGGYDSACLTALLQKNSEKKINTFTIGVSNQKLNEAPFAKAIAKHLGTNHNELICNEADFIELINKIPYYYDEPFADSSAIPTMLVSKMAKKQVSVALSADGGDEVFAGYNRYDYIIKLNKGLLKLPLWLRKLMAEVMQVINPRKIPIFKNRYNFHERYEKLIKIILNASDNQIMLALSTIFSEKELINLNAVFTLTKHSLYYNNFLQKENYTSLRYIMAIDYITYLPDDILQKVDRASMSNSIEAREPWLDHRLIEFSAQLPDSYKYNKGIKKYILKEITHTYIPAQLMQRPKMGFAIPLEDWLRNNLKHTTDKFFGNAAKPRHDLYNNALAKQYYQSFLNKKQINALKIWHLLCFETWFEKWN
ncbi:MAG: asparagine synthase (glutamine-hydrolyzing) [Bacteroidetes bacterium]|nr:asparagine synthase (glutamine-hydrolyzing) [Bacteroidota bacterium]